MDLSIEDIERSMDALRGQVRRAAQAGDQSLTRQLKAQLRRLQAAWDEALNDLTPAKAAAPAGPARAAALVPLREQVHHALTLLTVPAAPRLIVAVHAAFFGADVPSSRLTSLRRDEEKSFCAAPLARPYYLCPALTADRLAPARALLSVSTWPIADRIVGPLSPRVHFLTSAIRIAEAVGRLDDPRPEARRLLWRFAANIPGGSDDGGSSEAVAVAARAELVLHEEADRATRERAARRAQRLSDVQRLFGVRLAVAEAEDAG